MLSAPFERRGDGELTLHAMHAPAADREERAPLKAETMSRQLW